MAMLFRSDDLQVTDDVIRCNAGTFAIGDVRSAWVTRRPATRGSRALTAALGIKEQSLAAGGAVLDGWITKGVDGAEGLVGQAPEAAEAVADDAGDLAEKTGDALEAGAEKTADELSNP